MMGKIGWFLTPMALALAFGHRKNASIFSATLILCAF
jgi:hypothetical protein